MKITKKTLFYLLPLNFPIFFMIDTYVIHTDMFLVPNLFIKILYKFYLYVLTLIFSSGKVLKKIKLKLKFNVCFIVINLAFIQ